MHPAPRNILAHSAGPLLLVLALVPSACSRASYAFRPAPSYSPAVVVGGPAADCEIAAPLARSPSSLLFAAPASVRQGRRPPRLARRQPAASLQRVAPAAPLVSLLPQLVIRKVFAAEPLPARHRARGIALVLALVLGIFGAHRIYLGYYGAGATYLVGTVIGGTLLAVGSAALLFGGIVSGTTGYLVVGGAIVLALGIWALFDIIRILTGTLKPRKGEYHPRWFQIRAGAGPLR